jgi:hypothetical protein
VYSVDFSFQVSLSLIGLDHAPGVVRSYITEKDSVVGWGKMRVKDASGVPSPYLNVLQVQTTIIKIDSFYINGVPAPLALLSIFNLTQGKTDSTFLHNYYRAQEITPLAEVRFSNGTFTQPRKATTHVQRLFELGVAGVFVNGKVSIFPNPLTGNEIRIDHMPIDGKWEYLLTDITGKQVRDGTLNVTSGSATISLLSKPVSGIYYISLIKDGVLYSSKAIELE